jgi:hypothetical protein
MTNVFPIIVRKAFDLLPEESSHIATNAPRWAQVFTPDAHQGALDPNRSVVVGDRGTGKSFWTSVLINDKIRNLVARSYPRLGLERVESHLGFSEAQMAADHPGPAAIAEIMASRYSAEDLWRAVLLRFAPLPVKGLPPKSTSWKDMVDWIVADPGRRNAEFRDLDQNLIQQRKTYVLVFDSLDVMANDWNGIRKQMEGLILLALAVRALQANRLK